MAEKRWLLMDRDDESAVGAVNIARGELSGAAAAFEVTTRTLTDGRRAGVQLIDVDNGASRFTVCPTRGMALWQAECGGLRYGWKSPVRGPVHPNYVPVFDPSGLGWLEGFDELLVRCGMESNGAPDFDEEGRLAYPLHGRVGNLPAHRVELVIDEDSGLLRLEGEVDEVRFHFHKTRLVARFETNAGERSLRLHDSVVNLSASPASVQMLYHFNIGEPLLDSGSRVLAPAKTVVPRDEVAGPAANSWGSFSAEQPGFAEQVYFFEIAGDDDGAATILLKNAHSSAGVAMHYNTRELPCFTLWKNTTASLDGYVCGLEPGLNFPNPRSHEAENNRVVALDAGKQLDFHIAWEWLPDAATVAAAEAQAAPAIAAVEPRVFSTPQPGW